MGLLIDGTWHDQWYDTNKTGGKFVREQSTFHGILGSIEFPAEEGRYHLFVSHACPWAHRAMIFRQLKQLESLITVTVVEPKMLAKGWEFSEVSHNNPIDNVDYLSQVYTLANPKYTGRVTVPLLWDKKQSTIVCNESSEIIRQFNSAFNQLTGNTDDYYPAALATEIDEVNARVYEAINNGVYRCGFATEQGAYNEAYAELFAALDWLEQRLTRQRYLVGNQITEADWRLFTTLVRFDSVYYSHFKANKKRIIDYPNLWGYICELYQIPGIADTVDMDHIKTHYFYSHTTINPTQIIPQGPEIDFNAPHRREQLG